MSNQVQYAPFQPSRLASSPHPHPVSHPSSSDLPSSPTTASFYNPTHAIPRSTSSRPRLHKSQSSTRTSSARNRSFQLSSSSPSAPSNTTANPFRLVHENARLQRAKENRPTRELDKGDLSLIPDEPGGWTRDGQWEEFDQYERERLEIEMINERKEWKYRMRLQEEMAEDNMLNPDDEFQDDEGDMGEEPPLDVLSEYEPPFPSPLDPAANHLPSLASSISSSPFLGPSSIPPSPASEQDDTSMSLNPSQDHFEESLKAFESTFLDSRCPRCGMKYVIGRTSLGAGCTNCASWEISMDVLEPLKTAFARHGDAREGHVPLFTWTQFTGTLVLCRACDEQFAA
ncbi:hypothetical protein JCM5353_008236 [Sporobolomyces roseus]